MPSRFRLKSRRFFGPKSDSARFLAILARVSRKRSVLCMDSFIKSFKFRALLAIFSTLAFIPSGTWRESMVSRLKFWLAWRLYAVSVRSRRFLAMSRMILLVSCLIFAGTTQLLARRGGSVGSGHGFRQSKVKTMNLKRYQTGNPRNPFKFSAKKPKLKAYKRPF